MVSVKDFFTEFPLKSPKGLEVTDILKRSYLDKEYSTKWIPLKIYSLNNSNLNQFFIGKVEELKRSGCRDDEIDVKYGFVVENDIGNLLLTIQNGFSVKDSDYNSIGYNSMGVYVCKHADVCLQHTIVKTTGCDVIRLLLCKYVTGKITTAIPRIATVGEFIEPTPGFNTHISVIQPSVKDSLQTQYDRSQVYLYDLDGIQQPLIHPRHVFPYALVIFTINSTIPPHLENEIVTLFSAVDKKDSKPDILANTKLQQVINQINAKGPPELLGLSNNHMMHNVSDILPISVIGVGASPQSRVTKNSVIVNNNLLSSSENMQLQKVIDQLNAKYENESNANTNLLIKDAPLLNSHNANNNHLSTIISLDDYINNANNNKLRQQQTQHIDLLTSNQANLLQYAKQDLAPYQTLNLISTGANQFGYHGNNQTTSDLNQLLAGYSQLQGVTLPTVGMPTMIALDSSGNAIFGQNSGTNALYQQELIPIDYLSSVSSPSLVSRNMQVSMSLQQFYNDQSIGYSVVGGTGGLKRTFVGEGGSNAGVVVDKRARLV